MKQFACLDFNDTVIAIEFLNPANGDSYNGAYAYVQVGPGGIVENVPEIGQKWDGETISFK
jgi:hypothetical protein